MHSWTSFSMRGWTPKAIKLSKCASDTFTILIDNKLRKDFDSREDSVVFQTGPRPVFRVFIRQEQEKHTVAVSTRR